MRQNCTKNVWSAPFLALPFIADLNYDMRGAGRLPFLLRYTGERKVIAAMDATLQNVIEIALQQGIWAGLYIYLFFRMLKQNEERETQYQATIDKLSDDIQSGIENIQSRLDVLEEKISDKFEK
ncbi:MAG: BhlA/UviB family holin-like peptide [Christensenellales bacterium]|jgi:hypothetical protein